LCCSKAGADMRWSSLRARTAPARTRSASARRPVARQPPGHQIEQVVPAGARAKRCSCSCSGIARWLNSIVAEGMGQHPRRRRASASASAATSSAFWPCSVADQLRASPICARSTAPTSASGSAAGVLAELLVHRNAHALDEDLEGWHSPSMRHGDGPSSCRSRPTEKISRRTRSRPPRRRSRPVK